MQVLILFFRGVDAGRDQHVEEKVNCRMSLRR